MEVMSPALWVYLRTIDENNKIHLIFDQFHHDKKNQRAPK